VTVGSDRALAFGNIWQRNPGATATNNLEIKKNQDSGSVFAATADRKCFPCHDCCIKVNMEQVNVGNREAMAFGSATATNNIKVVVNQQ